MGEEIKKIKIVETYVESGQLIFLGKNGQEYGIGVSSPVEVDIELLEFTPEEKS